MSFDVSRYLGLFVAEAGEHLSQLAAELVRLESGARGGADVAELVDGLFRHAHSVKGMAGSMEQHGIAALAHCAEDLVEAFRRRGSAPDPESVDVLLAAVDGLTGMLARAAQGEKPEVEPALLERVEAGVARARGEERGSSQAPLPAAPAPAPPLAAPAHAERTVRVRVDLLDSFLDAVGELILATSRLRELGRAVPAPHRPALEEGVHRLHATVRDLHDKVMAVRMTPLSAVTDGLPRAARDLARRLGKQVEVEVSGAEIELDRALLDELADPLTHLLRNAVDHGLESPPERLRAGKSATGHVVVAARRERDRVLVEIADDGRGMDPARLRAAAVARGALTVEAAARLADREALSLACLPGVSTASELTELSGRGVGLDAVKRGVEAVGGALEIDSARGRGTRFLLRLPLTVVLQQVLLVRVEGEVLALPVSKVHGAAEVPLAALDTSGGAPMLPYDGALVPVRDLGALLGFGGVRPAPCAVVVAEGDGGRVGLAVDALVGQEEAVLKPLSRPFDLVPGLSALTVLASGRPVFVLDVARLAAP